MKDAPSVAATDLPPRRPAGHGLSYRGTAQGAGTRNGFEPELRRLNVVQKNGRPIHLTTQGKGERFQQTMPGPVRDPDIPDRVRHDRIDKSGTVTPRVHGQLRDIGIGRTHKRTHVILLAQDLHVRVLNAITGELLRELTIDPNKDYQPRTPK